MKKASKRPSDPRYLSNTTASRSKIHADIKPQRTFAFSSEPSNPHSFQNLLMDNSKQKILTDETLKHQLEEPELDEIRAYIWAMALKNEKMVSKLVATDKEIEDISLDLPNQRVLNGDCMRTRVSDFTGPLKAELEKLLTFYCKKENLTYKQGLNEVAAPFINFRKKTKVDLSNIYNYLVLFIDRFLPTAFIDKDFISLQCCFKILNILLRYHDPAFYTFLERNDYPPEIYATPWFLTLFANKLSLDMVYQLWDIYILENDPYLIFFFSLALLLENKNRIMASETYMIPQSLANLNIETGSQLTEIFKKAIDLKLNTPSSFLGSLQELDIFRKGYLDQDELKMTMHRNMELLEQLQCVLMSPYEIVNTLYSTEPKCSNPKCANYKQFSLITSKEMTSYGSFLSDNELERPRAQTPGKRESKTRDSFYTKASTISDESRVQTDKEAACPCIFCRVERVEGPTIEMQKHLEKMPHISQILNYKKSQRPWLEFLILDLRINRDDGLLPKSPNIDLTKLESDTINCLINDLIELRGHVHFVFMTTEFNSASFRNYIKDFKGRTHLASPPPRRQFPNSKLYKKKEYKFVLAEEDEENILFRFLGEFQQNGFPYLSVLEGGFSGVNRVLHDMNLEVLNHNKEKCGICNGRGGEKKNSLFNFFNKVFDKTEGKKINLFVEGMNSKTPSRGIYGQENKGQNYKSQAFYPSKKEKTGRTPSDFKEKPRSITSIPTTSQTITSMSINDIPDYSLQASSYTLAQDINRARNPGASYFKPSDTSVRQRPPASENVSLIYKDGEENIDASRITLQQESDEIEKPLQPNNQKQWELPFKSYFDVQISPRVNNYSKTSLQQKRNLLDHASTAPQESSLIKKDSQIHEFCSSGPLGSTLHASRYVFDSKKKNEETTDQKRPESIELKSRRFVSPQEERYVTLSEAHKAKNPQKSSSITQSTSIGKGTSLRKNLGHESYHSKKLYINDLTASRGCETPIGQILMGEDDTLGQKLKDESKLLTKQDQGGKVKDDMYFSAPDPGIQKRESLTSPKAAIQGKKVINYGKESYQSFKDTKKKDSGKETQGRNGVSLSLTAVHTTTHSLASTVVEFPNMTEFSNRKQVDSFRKEGLLDRKDSIERTFDISGIKSPLKTVHSPSPIRGIMNISRDKFQREKSEDLSTRFKTTQDRGLTEEDKRLTDINEKGPLRPLDIQQSFYNKNGILERVRIVAKDHMHFYKMFENVKFSYFVSDHVWKIPKEDSATGNALSSHECLTKRILVISKDFLVSVQYENEVLDNLRLLQKGFSLEKMLQYSEERRSLIGSLDIKTPTLKSSNNTTSPKACSINGKISSNPKERACMKREIIVEAMFPTKLLVRITSRKQDAKYLSFYFRLPTLEKLKAVNGGQLLTLTENNVQDMSNMIKREEYSRILKEINDSKESNSYIESKSLYCFENENAAQECINKTKEAHTLATSYLNEKLGRK